jgi:glycosyltransferase involved in cell wall biosynthesis
MSSERTTARSGAVAAASGAPAPAVSVIIPAYGVAQYIAGTLDSVFAQTYRDFEIIVVNDGCPDSAALEAALRPYRERIVYLRKENGGVSSARNVGMGAARAPLIALLDGDDAWLPDFLAVQTDYLHSHPHTDIVYCDGTIFGDTPLVDRTMMEFSPSRGEVTFESLLWFRCSVMLSSVVARKGVILAVGGFDESLRRAEDFDLWVRAAHAGTRISYHRRVLFRYRERTTGLSEDGVTMREAGLLVLDKLERRLRLSASEQAALANARQACRADVSYYRVKAAIRGRDARTARAAVSELLRLRWTVKFAVLAFALRWAPRLTMSLADRRDH